MKLFLISIFFILSSPWSIYGQDIFDAVRKGDMNRIRFLCKLDPDTLNSKNPAGFTPLIIASYRGQTQAVAFLLEQKVNINANSSEGTALIAACFKNDPEIVSLLLRYHADPNLQNEQGSSALIFAVQSGNTAIVKLLLDHGAKKGLKERSGRTALNYAENSSEMATLLSE